jgi:hypothetical protein
MHAGSAAPPGVASQLARAAVASSYSDAAAAAAAAAASRNTFAAWAERVAQDPQAAAQKVNVVPSVCFVHGYSQVWVQGSQKQPWFVVQAQASMCTDRMRL